MSQISLLRGRIWWCEAWNCRLQQPLQQSNESTPDLFSQSTLTCASSSSPRSRGLPIRAINISNRRCKLSSGRKFWVKEVDTNWIELYLEPPSINDLLDLIKHAYSTCVYVTNSCSNFNQKTLGISYFKILFNQTRVLETNELIKHTYQPCSIWHIVSYFPLRLLLYLPLHQSTLQSWNIHKGCIGSISSFTIISDEISRLKLLGW